MKATGSAMIRRLRSSARGPFQLATISSVRPAVSPTVSTTNRISVQTVERTERIFVHSAASRPPNRTRRAARVANDAGAGATGDVVATGALPSRVVLCRAVPGRLVAGRAVPGLAVQRDVSAKLKAV